MYVLFSVNWSMYTFGAKAMMFSAVIMYKHMKTNAMEQ